MFEQSSMDWGKFAYLLSHHLSHRRRMNLNENRLLPYLVVVKVTCRAHIGNRQTKKEKDRCKPLLFLNTF